MQYTIYVHTATTYTIVHIFCVFASNSCMGCVYAFKQLKYSSCPNTEVRKGKDPSGPFLHFVLQPLNTS